MTLLYLFAFLVSIRAALLSDKYRWRGPAFTFILLPLSIIGFAMAYGGQKKPGHQYAGIRLLAAGDYFGPSVSLSWVSFVTASHYKRATAPTLMIVFTNFGGTASTWLWNDAASKGFLVNLVLHIVGLALFGILEVNVLYDRARRVKPGS